MCDMGCREVHSKLYTFYLLARSDNKNSFRCYFVQVFSIILSTLAAEDVYDTTAEICYWFLSMYEYPSTNDRSLSLIWRVVYLPIFKQTAY